MKEKKKERKDYNKVHKFTKSYEEDPSSKGNEVDLSHQWMKSYSNSFTFALSHTTTLDFDLLNDKLNIDYYFPKGYYLLSFQIIQMLANQMTRKQSFDFTLMTCIPHNWLKLTDVLFEREHLTKL